MTGKWLCLPVALCVLSGACGGKKPEATDKGAPHAAPAAPEVSPTAVVEAPKGTFVMKFRLGSTSGPDGVVGVETRTFAPGETVFASFEIANPPAGSKIRVAWALLPDKKPISRQELSLSPDKTTVAVKADTKGWAVGEYELETTLTEPGKDETRSMGTAQFKLAKDKQK